MYFPSIIGFQGYVASCASFAITDNLGNVIKNFGEISTATSPKWQNVSLTIGDLDYSGKVSAEDANHVLKYITKQVDFSNIQKCLADVDEDGDVDATDANKILNISVGNG